VARVCFRTVNKLDLYLRQRESLRPVTMRTTEANVARVPAVAGDDAECVVAGAQQWRDVGTV